MRLCGVHPRTAVLCGLLALTAACGIGVFRQYEYEEEMYLSLDGSATVYVNGSIPAINALHGTSFDASPTGRFDRSVFREYFSSPHTNVVRVSSSRRSGRRFVHVRVEVDDVRRLGRAPAFAWSTYDLTERGDQVTYIQHVGAPLRPALSDPGAPAPASNGIWRGNELVAFRLHLPSKIDYHNTPTHEVGRGNILTWEQSLGERLRGIPLVLEARMEAQSILYRTLWLFAATFVAVAVVFAAVIWWIFRRGRPAKHAVGEA